MNKHLLLSLSLLITSCALAHSHVDSNQELLAQCTLPDSFTKAVLMRNWDTARRWIENEPHSVDELEQALWFISWKRMATHAATMAHIESENAGMAGWALSFLLNTTASLSTLLYATGHTGWSWYKNNYPNNTFLSHKKSLTSFAIFGVLAAVSLQLVRTKYGRIMDRGAAFEQYCMDTLMMEELIQEKLAAQMVAHPEMMPEVMEESAAPAPTSELQELEEKAPELAELFANLVP